MRIYLIAGYLPICFLCWTLATLRFVGLVVITAYALRLKAITLLITDFRWLILLATSIGGATDSVIALSLCYALWATKRGFDK